MPGRMVREWVGRNVYDKPLTVARTHIGQVENREKNNVYHKP